MYTLPIFAEKVRRGWALNPNSSIATPHPVTTPIRDIDFIFLFPDKPNYHSYCVHCSL